MKWLETLLLLLAVAAVSDAHAHLRNRIGLALRWRAPNLSGYSYETKYFTQKLDHFNAGDGRTFQQRYLVNTEHWTHGGPIFLYTGNEGDITWFCNNTGFMWDIAPTYKAMLLFAEHRYYGQSLPFGPDSYKDAAHLNFLTSEQALADFATLISAVKEEVFNTTGSPVIAFGGSYGGMLTAWLRMKYPNIVEGAIAASAPIWYFSGLTPCNSAYVTITRDFEAANANCSANIHSSWEAIQSVASEGAAGLEWLTSTFRLCQPLLSSAELAEWLQGTWFNLAMVDYPYPANFLEPLPAWPINKTCAYLSTRLEDKKELLQALASSLTVYYNSTGTTKCYNTSQTSTSNLGTKGWDFQACTEMVMPMCTDGVEDMFPPEPWNLTAYEEECEQQFGVKPQPYWIETLYGGKNIAAHSNIVFSNGLLDPWSGGGVLHSISDSLVAAVIPNGAHHLDLRAATPEDPPEVKAVRQLEMQFVSKWIANKH